jgi:hypothetical protein
MEIQRPDEWATVLQANNDVDATGAWISPNAWKAVPNAPPLLSAQILNSTFRDTIGFSFIRIYILNFSHEPGAHDYQPPSRSLLMSSEIWGFLRRSSEEKNK